MKSTGVVRSIDELGRFVIPKEIRDELGFYNKTKIEVLVNENSVILKKYAEDKCIFCGSNKDLIEFKEKYICSNCVKEL